MNPQKVSSLEEDFIILLEEHAHHLRTSDICYHLIKLLTMIAYDTGKTNADAHHVIMEAIQNGVRDYLKIQLTKEIKIKRD